MDMNHKLILDNLFEGVYYVDHDLVISYWNKAAERITGYSAEEVIGKRCSANILRHIDADGNELCLQGCPLHATIEDGELREASVFLHHKDGHRVPVHIRAAPLLDEGGEILGGVELFSDNTRTLNMLQQLELSQQDNLIDPLLGVGNRRLGEKLFNNRFSELRMDETPFSVAMMDIDGFKGANDRFGHAVGDRILEMVARSLESTLRTVDTIIRWGGDELLIILPNVGEGALSDILERIRIFTEKSYFMLDGEKISVSVSLGGTQARQEDDLQSLVDRADKLM